MAWDTPRQCRYVIGAANVVYRLLFELSDSAWPKSESQFPMLSPADSSQKHPPNSLSVKGRHDPLQIDGTPHVHRWRVDKRGEQSSVSTCSRCRAKKISTQSETVIDYQAHSIDQLGTSQMQHCDHEWRRTGSGEECWKCGKPRGDGMDMYF